MPKAGVIQPNRYASSAYADLPQVGSSEGDVIAEQSHQKHLVQYQANGRHLHMAFKAHLMCAHGVTTRV